MKNDTTVCTQGFCDSFVVSIFFVLFFSLMAVGEQCDPASVTIDGQTVFPLGWYAMHASDYNTALGMTPLNESQQHGFDYVMPYYPFWSGDTPVLAYMDEAGDRGVKVLIDIHDCTLTELQRRVNLVKNYEALYGYYLDDEPEIRSISASEIISRYNAVKQLDSDPNHPVILTLYNSLASTQAYLPGADIIVRELYVNSYLRDTVRSDVGIARNAGKGYLVAPGPFQTSNRTLPTAAEMRFAFLASVAAGAGGFMPFIFEGHVGAAPGPPTTGYRDSIVYPTTDLVKSIAPLLAKGANGLNVTSQYADYGTNDVAWVIAGDAKNAVLVAANFNTSSASPNVDFTITGLDSSITTGIVVGESRSVSLGSGGTFTDSFSGDEIHIYRFTKVPQSRPENGLVGYWPLDAVDGNNETYDLSGNNNICDASYFWQSCPGMVNQGMKFQETSANCGNSSSFDVADDITVEMWFCPTDWVGGYATRPIQKGYSTSDFNYVMYFFGDTSSCPHEIAFYANAGGTWQAVSPFYEIPALNVWYHIAWTYNSTEGGRLYINGISQGSPVGSGVLVTNTADLQLGGNDSYIFFDEVKIYSRILADNEILNHYRKMVGTWRFSEGTGSLTEDLANNTDSTIYGCSWVDTYVTGNALSYDGQSDYVDCGKNPKYNQSDAITIKLSFYPEDWVDGYSTHLIRKWDTTSSPTLNANYVMYFFGDTSSCANEIAFYANAGGTWQPVSPFYEIPALDTWYDIAWTYSSTEGGRLYINGVSQGTPVGSGVLAKNDAHLLIGNNLLTGIIDELEIHNWLLEDTLVGYWPMDLVDADDKTADLSLYYNHCQLDNSVESDDGMVDKAITFQGISGNCGNDSSLNMTNAITVRTWFCPNAWVDGYAKHPIKKWDTTSDPTLNANYVMYFFGDTSSCTNEIAFYANAGGTWQPVSPFYEIPALDTWYDITWTYSSTEGGKLYINGVSQGAAVAGGTLATNAGDLQFGETNLDISLDEVKIYSRVLTSEEISE